MGKIRAHGKHILLAFFLRLTTLLSNQHLLSPRKHCNKSNPILLPIVSGLQFTSSNWIIKPSNCTCSSIVVSPIRGTLVRFDVTIARYCVTCFAKYLRGMFNAELKATCGAFEGCTKPEMLTLCTFLLSCTKFREVNYFIGSRTCVK